METERRIADALGAVLLRGFRLDLHQRLVDGVASGLDTSTYPVLSTLARLGSASAASIAVEIGLDRSGVSRRLTILADAGLVELHNGIHDARQVHASLTAAGTTAIETTRRRLDEAIRQHLAGWDDIDRQRFADLFTRFAEEPLRSR